MGILNNVTIDASVTVGGSLTITNTLNSMTCPDPCDAFPGAELDYTVTGSDSLGDSLNISQQVGSFSAQVGPGETSPPIEYSTFGSGSFDTSSPLSLYDGTGQIAFGLDVAVDHAAFGGASTVFNIEIDPNPVEVDLIYDYIPTPLPETCVWCNGGRGWRDFDPAPQNPLFALTPGMPPVETGEVLRSLPPN